MAEERKLAIPQSRLVAELESKHKLAVYKTGSLNLMALMIENGLVGIRGEPVFFTVGAADKLADLMLEDVPVAEPSKT